MGGVCLAARTLCYMTPTSYDPGLYNRSRNRARNWVHSRIWPSRDYFLSTPSTRKTTIASLLSLALLWQILSSTGFPNQFFNDSWVVGFWRGLPWVARRWIGKRSLDGWLKP